MSVKLILAVEFALVKGEGGYLLTEGAERRVGSLKWVMSVAVCEDVMAWAVCLTFVLVFGL